MPSKSKYMLTLTKSTEDIMKKRKERIISGVVLEMIFIEFLKTMALFPSYSTKSSYYFYNKQKYLFFKLLRRIRV